MIRVGPAGWSYPDWEGRVYPAAKPPGFHPLPFLARTFDLIEVNSSFYAMPRREHVERWVQLVHDRPSFRFAIKLLREFTHGPEPAEHDGAWEREAEAFRAALEPVRHARRLSAVLVQFPVGFLHGKAEVRRLGRLRGLLDGLPLVLEVRHESWFAPPALAAVRGLGYSLAYVDLPPAWNHPPAWHAPTGPIGYLRLHGRNSEAWFRHDAHRDQRYDHLYSREELGPLADRARRIQGEHGESNVVTNNHFAGKAIANGIEMLHLLRGEPVPAWSEIVEAFPRLGAITRVAGQQPLF